MTMLREVVGELIGMFLGEKPLAIALLLIVATTGFLTNFTGLGRLIGGVFLLSGCLILLVESVCRAARASGARPAPMPASPPHLAGCAVQHPSRAIPVRTANRHLPLLRVGDSTAIPASRWRLPGSSLTAPK